VSEAGSVRSGVADVVLANVASWVVVAHRLPASIRFKLDV